MEHRVIGKAPAELDRAGNDLVTHGATVAAGGAAGQGERGRIAGQGAGDEPITSPFAKLISHGRRLRWRLILRCLF
jgi:hypothetical protein